MRATAGIFAVCLVGPRPYRNGIALSSQLRGDAGSVRQWCMLNRSRYYVARMKKFWTDRIALVTSGIGIALMILTAVWRVQSRRRLRHSRLPYRQSVRRSAAARTDRYVHARVDPTVFSVVNLASFVGFPESDGFVLADGAAVIVQGIVYFMFGKLISGWAKRFRTGKEPNPVG